MFWSRSWHCSADEVDALRRPSAASPLDSRSYERVIADKPFLGTMYGACIMIMIADWMSCFTCHKAQLQEDSNKEHRCSSKATFEEWPQSLLDPAKKLIHMALFHYSASSGRFSPHGSLTNVAIHVFEFDQ